MGKPTGFLEFDREYIPKRDVTLRKNDYKEVEENMPLGKVTQQASRCMDCGTPFCHSGCPLGNIIPEFNDAVFNENWEYAYEILASTNNFPEFTGRICPAPCEASCVLGINKPPVTIEHIEKNIIEYAFANNLVQPRKPEKRTGKTVAVIGSGPAGLAAASQLNKAGHTVTLFERADKIGGLLRYGIPDFKLDKMIIDRRIEVMEKEGVIFKTNTNVGVDIKTKDLLEQFDLVMLTGGSTVPYEIGIPGYEQYLGKGLHPAMEFLSQQNKRVSGTVREKDHQGYTYANGELFATDKNVVVIGGGDTGSDCVGTSNRHNATSITQVEVMPVPTFDDKTQPYYKYRDPQTPWPLWPMTKRTSTSHEEGCERLFAIDVQEFIGDGTKLTKLKIGDISYGLVDGKMQRQTVNIREIDCDLALVAAGFKGLEEKGLIAELEEMGLELNNAGNPARPFRVVKTDNYQTAIDKVFAAGDIRRGQSLVVWAISEGREAARAADEFLMGSSTLESKTKSVFALA
jgi:glutamate synthase (NADPH) small chain